jgi:hypothetical protein
MLAKSAANALTATGFIVQWQPNFDPEGPWSFHAPTRRR